MPDRKPSTSPPTSPGLAARRVAVDIVSGVLRQKRPLDDLLERSEIGALPERTRSLPARNRDMRTPAMSRLTPVRIASGADAGPG